MTDPPDLSGSAPARWVPVARFNRDEEARLLAGRLRAEGIEANVYPDWQGGYYGESVNLLVTVLVQEHRVLEARAIIEELERTMNGGKTS
jgi:putative signal transducing protein